MLNIYGAARHFERDAWRWGLLPRKALVIMPIPLVIMLAMVAAVPFSDVFVWITAEDSLMESIQLLLLLGAGLIFARLGLMLIRGGQREGLLCLLVALAIFFVAGEEVAWGQRLLGWETPEKLKAINYQNETTLHNIGPAHQLSIYAVMLGGLYGSIIPLFTLSKRAGRAHSTLRYLLIPPICLVPSFLMPFGYRLSRLLFPLEEWFPHLIFYITKFSEVTELCLYFGLFSFAWLNLARLKREELKI
jgi:hypothetical protein